MRSLAVNVSKAKLSGAMRKRDEVARHGVGRRVARIGEVGQQDRDLLARLEVEQLLMERAARSRNDRPTWGTMNDLRRLEVDEADVVRLGRGELCVAGPSATGTSGCTTTRSATFRSRSRNTGRVGELGVIRKPGVSLLSCCGGRVLRRRAADGTGRDLGCIQCRVGRGEHGADHGVG